MKRLLPLSLAILSAQGFVHADEAKEELEIVVTAERLPSTAGAGVTVITREEIEQQGVASVADLLKSQAGIDIAVSGNAHNQTSLFLRGTNSNHTLVLVDGIRVNSANTGGFDFSTLRPEDIERIEIVRGPYASRYGSDAIGGVIQIFTRSPDRPSLHLGAGSHGTAETAIAVGANGFSLRGSAYRTDGIDATNAGWGNRDHDGTEEYSAHVGWQGRIANDTKLDVRLGHQKNYPEFDNGASTGQLNTAAVRLHNRMTPDWEQALDLGWMRDRLESNYFPYKTIFTTERRSFAWNHRIKVNNHLNLRTGFDHQHEAGLSEEDLTAFGAGINEVFDHDLDASGVHVGFDVATGPVSWQLDGRHDQHERFDGHDTGNIRAQWQVVDAWTLVAGYGSAFHAPTLNDLYHPGLAPDPWGYCVGPANCFVGNPNLKPETARTRDLGLRYRSSHWQAEVLIYRSRIRELIGVDYSQSDFPIVNIGKARIKGIEGTLSGDHDTLDWRLTAQHLDTVDGNGNELLRRPQAKGSMYLHWQHTNQVGSFQEFIAVNDANDFGAKLHGYGLLNLGVDFKPTPTIRTGLRVDNVLDRDYTVVNGYNTAGITGRVTLDIQF